MHVADIGKRRALPISLHVFPGQLAKPVAVEVVGHIAGEHEAGPIYYRLYDNGSAKAIGVADNPGGEYAAAASARDKQPLVVDVAALNHGVDSRHEVIVILIR